MSDPFPPLPDLSHPFVNLVCGHHVRQVERGEAVIKELEAGYSIMGLSDNLKLYGGYDFRQDILEGTADDELLSHNALHPSDAVAIADAMINRWQRFRAIHAARVDLVPPNQDCSHGT